MSTLLQELAELLPPLNACVQAGLLVGAVLVLGMWKRLGGRPALRGTKAGSLVACVDGSSLKRSGPTPCVLVHCLQRLRGDPKRSQKQCEEEARLRRQQRSTRYYSQAICACARERNWRAGCQLLNEMIRKRIPPTVVMFNSMINCCGRASQLAAAFELFEKMAKVGCEPNSQTYSILAVSCKDGMLDKSFELIMEMKERGLKPGPVTLNVVLGACTAQGRPKDALRLFDELPVGCYTADAGTYNALITACERMREPSKALRYFELMHERGVKPDTITYNALMTGLAKGKGDVGLQLFERMGREGIPPDTTTYNLMINAFARAGKVARAYALFEDMLRQGLEPSVLTYVALMTACNKANKPERALQTFQDMKDKGLKLDTVSYNGAIKACGLLGDASKAVNLYKEMINADLVPNMVTHTCLITTCSQGGLPGMAFHFFEEIKKAGNPIDQVAFTCVLVASAVSGDSARALRYLQDMAHRGLPTGTHAYNTVVDAFARNGHGEEALVILEKMKASDGSSCEGSVVVPKPDAMTYNAIIPGVSAAKATELFNEMVAFGLQPNRRVYTSLERKHRDMGYDSGYGCQLGY